MTSTANDDDLSTSTYTITRTEAGYSVTVSREDWEKAQAEHMQLMACIKLKVPRKPTRYDALMEDDDG